MKCISLGRMRSANVIKKTWIRPIFKSQHKDTHTKIVQIIGISGECDLVGGFKVCVLKLSGKSLIDAYGWICRRFPARSFEKHTQERTLRTCNEGCNRVFRSCLRISH